MQGLVKVGLSRIKNPSKSPFTKGRLLISPFGKGGKGGIFGIRAIRAGETDFDFAVILGFKDRLSVKKLVLAGLV